MKKPFNVIFEDNHLLVVNKSAGILVQGDKTGDKTLTDLCKTYIANKYNKPGAVFLHPVHRLDRPVSGVVVFARTSKALERMTALFRKREVHKVYWALVKRKPREETGKLTHWLVKNPEKNVTTAYDKEVPESKKSEMTYKRLGKLNDHWLLELRPVTGRPHQLRVQLASMDCPIRGDVKYGFPKPNPDASINLHAFHLVFIHPIKKEKLFLRAALPEEPFWEQFLEFENIKSSDRHLDKTFSG
ncbi:RluA family pseudouridine synthase [Cyclobacterium amurskyense]|uniref:Pseudouridine synthase n=1 Tax=Cyclobacterium amurskyense TaxID=320787 RepID=A0A0H4PPX2_9BACT|nr:RluA family pseudouridine synthase [Cyclobacterium amurskyense]AKP50317.1 Pseudouridine synthase [Cyclobacterium amurskyense]|tara:strand:- start:15812 stop:16543 length:732 start_codon:yes stop_codon:yes gene_type:complete